MRDIEVLACATSNVLTLHPKEERAPASMLTVDSHRRLDLAAQFQTPKLVFFGQQETLLASARALGIGLYYACAAAANKRGQKRA